MPRTIDLIRASKLPSNMMQFAAKGALNVPPNENLEILVYLAKHNKIFGDTARLTLAGWDEKTSLAAASDPKTASEVLNYMIAPDNLRPKLLPALLENPSVPEKEIVKFAISASQESITTMLQSARAKESVGILEMLLSNPYLKGDDKAKVVNLIKAGKEESAATEPDVVPEVVPEVAQNSAPTLEAIPDAGVVVVVEADVPAEAGMVVDEVVADEAAEVPDESVSAYIAEHATEIAAENNKPFQPVGGIVDLLGTDYFPVVENKHIAETAVDAAEPVAPATAAPAIAGPPSARSAPAAVAKPKPAAKVDASKRDNTVQKINRLDVKGRIHLAMKGNKEERSILIRDGTKVVALAVLDAPKLSDGEVEKFALQKNVLEAVLRQIPLKRRFMKNYIVVRNLVANPRTPLDLGLGLMKHLLAQDLKNISANKEVSETVRKLALKMYKQKLDAANKK